MNKTQKKSRHLHHIQVTHDDVVLYVTYAPVLRPVTVQPRKQTNPRPRTNLQRTHPLNKTDIEHHHPHHSEAMLTLTRIMILLAVTVQQQRERTIVLAVLSPAVRQVITNLTLQHHEILVHKHTDTSKTTPQIYTLYP